MYLLLILYSIINLNVVSWGTREVQTKKTKKVSCIYIKYFYFMTCIDNIDFLLGEMEVKCFHYKII